MTAPLRVFLDSNVLISALIGAPDSPPVVLIDWFAGGQMGVLLSGKCNLSEVERNLTRKLPAAITLWKSFLGRAAVVVVPCPKHKMSGINLKDMPIVAAAQGAQATHFVTGDRKLIQELRKSPAGAIHVVSPREMLEWIVASGAN